MENTQTAEGVSQPTIQKRPVKSTNCGGQGLVKMSEGMRNCGGGKISIDNQQEPLQIRMASIRAGCNFLKVIVTHPLLF
tara:strand:+ start:166 stop:402 length:237 start_codon:yes stop_codon:yes gene_type:complete